MLICWLSAHLPSIQVSLSQLATLHYLSFVNPHLCAHSMLFFAFTIVLPIRCSSTVVANHYMCRQSDRPDGIAIAAVVETRLGEQ